MPKKTRKEKILAQRRRHISTSSINSSVSPTISSPGEHSVSTFQYKAATHHVAQDHQTATDTMELKTIKIDLLKTIIFAVLAIGAELSIYWQLAKK